MLLFGSLSFFLTPVFMLTLIIAFMISYVIIFLFSCVHYSKILFMFHILLARAKEEDVIWRVKNRFGRRENQSEQHIEFKGRWTPSLMNGNNKSIFIGFSAWRFYLTLQFQTKIVSFPAIRLCIRIKLQPSQTYLSNWSIYTFRRCGWCCR